jgi:hypothetical protein
MFSRAERAAVAHLEIHHGGRHDTILRVSSAAGEVLRELTLLEGSAGHFLDQRCGALLYLSDGAPETGVMHRLPRGRAGQRRDKRFRSGKFSLHGQRRGAGNGTRGVLAKPHAARRHP